MRAADDPNTLPDLRAVDAGKSAAEFPHLPFCSERCRRIDLGRWLGETYRIPGLDTSVPSADATTTTPRACSPQPAPDGPFPIERGVTARPVTPLFLQSR